MARPHVLLPVVLSLLAGSVCHAGTLISTDFSQGAKGWVLNGTAQLLPGSPQLLSLTQNQLSQTGVAWTEIQGIVPSFSFIADVRVRFEPKDFGECPADGFALVFSPADVKAIGNGGSELGIFGLERFVAFEVNTWYGQGLGDTQSCFSATNETFAFDVIDPSVEDRGRTGGTNGLPDTGGAKIGQVLAPKGLRIVNGGFYRYQWNVDAEGTMSVYLSGLEEFTQQFQTVLVLRAKFLVDRLLDFEGRWGLSAATGGAAQHTEVLFARIDSPMIAPVPGFIKR